MFDNYIHIYKFTSCTITAYHLACSPYFVVVFMLSIILYCVSIPLLKRGYLPQFSNFTTSLLASWSLLHRWFTNFNSNADLNLKCMVKSCTVHMITITLRGLPTTELNIVFFKLERFRLPRPNSHSSATLACMERNFGRNRIK